MTQQNKWQAMPVWAKIGSMVMASIQVSLLVSALVDIRRRPAQQVRGPKWAWAAVSFINFVGPISYFLFGRKHAELQLPQPPSPS